MSRYLPFLAVAVCAAPLLVWNGFVQQINASLGDVLLRLSGPGDAASVREITLVAIDDTTAAEYGPLPLSRLILAKGIERLSQFQPKVVALDLLLSEPSNPEADESLARALGQFPRLVLGAALEASGQRWIEPLPGFRNSAAIGHVHAEPEDGIARAVLLAKTGSRKRHWALGLEAARLWLGAEKPLERLDSLELGSIHIPTADHMLIHFAGPEGTFARVSFTSLLEGTVHPDLLRGKIVVLGVTAQGSGDRLFTPLSGGLGMSGIEIHANVIRTILDRAFLVPMGLEGEWLAYLVIAAACVAAGRARLMLLLSSGCLALPAVCWVALRAGRVWPLGSFFAVFLFAAATVLITALHSEQKKRKEHAFRVQSIAHEIRTPLTAIQGSSEMISEASLPDQKRVEMAGLIFKESKRLNSLIQVFLDVERIASGAVQIQKHPVNLESLCSDVLERARLYAARKNTTVEGVVPPILLEGDTDLLSFAIYNLLTNAVKYSPKDACVRLSARDEGGTVSISVTDQGYGIPPEEQRRIFEKFYRLKRDEAGSEQGAGIGLAMVQEIVAQHGGRIRVDSKPGAGSRFTVALPKS